MSDSCHINHTTLAAGLLAARRHIEKAKEKLTQAEAVQLDREKWTDFELAVFLQTELLNTQAALETAVRAIQYLEKHVAGVLVAADPVRG